MVPNIPVGFLTNQDGLLDQRGDEIEHFGRIHVLPTHALSGVEIEPTREHRQPPPQLLFGWRAEVVTPIDRQSQRLLTTRNVASTRCKKSVSIREPVHDLLSRHTTQASCRQLDRKWESIQVMTRYAQRRACSPR